MMMRYFNLEAITGDLILTKTNRPPPAACPVRARSASVPQPQPILTFILYLCTLLQPILCKVHNKSGHIEAAEAAIFSAICTIGDHWPPAIPRATRQKMAVLMFLAGVLATVILENCLENYLERIMVAL